MLPCTGRTVFDVPIRWNRVRFHTIRTKYRRARKLIEISINGIVVTYEVDLV